MPMPTLPEAEMSMLLVGAPGRIRKGRRDPLVTSRTKKLASLPAMSHVCAVKPPWFVCSSRWAGVSLVVMCRSNTGVAVLSPTLPVLLTLSELAGAPASTSKTIVPVSEFPAAPWSTKPRKLAPPAAELFALICQLLRGKPAALVSSNWMRVLFSFTLMVSKPKTSPSTQSRPTQALPWTIKSSGITSSGLAIIRGWCIWFLAAVVSGVRPGSFRSEILLTFRAPASSAAPATMTAPLTIEKPPDSTRFGIPGRLRAARTASASSSLPRAASSCSLTAFDNSGVSRSS